MEKLTLRSLKSELDGKIRISIGTRDNFLLNYAAMLLETQMKELVSNIQFAYFPGDHYTVYTPEYEKEGTQFLKKGYLERLNKSEE